VELGHALVTQLAPEELMATLTDSGRALFNARLCLLHDYDANTRELKLHAWSSSGDLSATGLSLQQNTVSADDALLASTLRVGRTTEYQQLDGERYREAADLPRDPNLCCALASFAAVALQNARLYSRVFQSEEVLRKNETLTTLGLLAAEIAHEIRNPLTVIKLLHGPLGADFGPDDPRRRDLQIITEKIEQLEDLVNRVLSFGRAPATIHSRWSLDEILGDTNHLLRAKLTQAGVQLRYTPPPHPVAIDAHKGQLQQVFLNLALNALHAMPQGGELRIICTVEGNTVHTDFTDTGGGIPPEVQPRIFESFLS
ncbi:MAG: histidine kinase dimerization/phospho-acceptor domain-containing protein, partial [Opitutus sp.]